MVQLKKPKLLWSVRSKIRTMRYSYQTEKTYVQWIKRFLHYKKLKHPTNMGEVEVNNFLTFLPVEKKVSPSTQNQALCALVYLYKHVLNLPLGENSIKAVRAKYQRNLPVVLSINEVRLLFNALNGLPKLMAQVIYGTGLRKSEVHRLRVKDIDFERNQISVRRGKGGKDRPLPLPQTCKDELKSQIDFVRQLFLRDRTDNINGVELPYAIERKYPNAGKSIRWQCFFQA